MSSRWGWMAAAVLMAGVAVLGDGAPAAAREPIAQGDLFYNYWVPSPDGVHAQLYVSPRPVPPNVGWTYITYQPLMPHEFLYKHHRVYRTDNPGAGPTRTRVAWR